MAGTIHLDRPEPGIARVIIDNQSRRNAISVAMWDRLGEVMRELNADDGVRCIIMRGAGEQAFGAGADISEFEETRSSAEKARTYAKRTLETLTAVKDCRHPVVAAVSGLCVGGGLELATCCDLRIASDDSRFGIPVKRLGLVVAYDEMKTLVDIVGKAAALRILLEGDLLDAAEALRIGLVTRVVGKGVLDEQVFISARKIAEGAPLVARWHKKFANRLTDPRPLTPEEADESYHCFDTEDFKIGSRSFLAKEKPSFVGR